MSKILQITTYGLKNLEKPIVLDFSNQTINKGINKINSVKGIYGYNGAGKTAVISSMKIYKNIIFDATYLLQNETRNELKYLINKKLNMFFVSCIFLIDDDTILKHSIKIKKELNTETYVIDEEKVELVNGRTFNDKTVTLIEKVNSDVHFNSNLNNYLSSSILNFNTDNSSIVSSLIQKMIEGIKQNQFKPSNYELLLIKLYIAMSKIEVCGLSSDEHRNSVITKNQILSVLADNEKLKRIMSGHYFTIDTIEDTVEKSEYEVYEKNIKGLEMFLKLFKPELKRIELEKFEDRDLYHIRKHFVYSDYSIEFEYESSGLKQLAKLYFYLKKCSDGSIVFIDEMDVNINSVYFNKLISYFTNYGKGQLIFTSHNIESMNAIKKQRRSIVVIGNEGNTDTWVSSGNRSPINDYNGGYFEHSPMNVEDFDFISVFSGE